MAESITIRPAVEADTAAMVKVNVDTLQATYTDFYPPHLLAARNYAAVEASWRQRLWHSPDIEEYPFVAETEAGQLVGVLLCGPIDDADYQAEIFALFVLPEYHNQGIGNKLVQSAATKLLELNLTRIIVWVFEGNPARGFYEAIGGEQVQEKAVEQGDTRLIKIGYGWCNIESLCKGTVTELATHNKVLRGKRVTLRPMTEEAWELLLKWNSDPEVLYFAEGDDVESYSMEDVQGMYRSVSRSAFCFIIEGESGPLGECWLQEMNLERILQRYPASRCHRIDLMIGEKEYWGRGLGSEVVKLLVQFAFAEQASDFVFGCDVADYNRGSQRVFEKKGFMVDTKWREIAGNKAEYRYDFVLGRNTWIGRR